MNECWECLVGAGIVGSTRTDGRTVASDCVRERKRASCQVDAQCLLSATGVVVSGNGRCGDEMQGRSGERWWT